MKLVTDYEVEGCWTYERENNPSRCRYCGSILEKVPIEGHYNSQYWNLKRNDGLDLFCCPNGCKLSLANKRMAEYLEVHLYCKEGSESYDYELDFSKFKNAWIEPNGKVHPLEYEGHADFAINLNTTERDLENKNWAKITTVDWQAINMSDGGFTLKQKDSIFEFCIAHNLDTKGLYEDKWGTFKFKPLLKNNE